MLGFRADLIGKSLSAGENDAETYQEAIVSVLPAALDWRNSTGIVAPMKNQASCGSCYSFAAMEALQGVYHVQKGPFTNGTVINLSE